MAPKLRVLLCQVACLIATSAAAEYTLTHKPDKHDPMRVHVYRLDNGLTVYLTENHEEPRFYAEIAVRAGSKHDPSQSTGIAHYLEHMLFKGTIHYGTLDFVEESVHLDSIVALYEQHVRERDPQRRAEIYALINEQNQLGSQFAIPGELDRIFTAMGAQHVNAHTWFEETVYKVDLPSTRLRQWARIEAERFRYPVFRLFQTELETVYEEKNRSMDNKDRLIREAVSRLLFKNHPYGQQTTLGSVEHLKNPSLTRMYKYYRAYYVPNNMGVFLSGDFEIAEAIDVIDTEFGIWEPKELPPAQRWQEEELQGVERVSVSYPGEEYVLLAFRTAPSTHKDTEALQLLDLTLDNANAGLININLNLQQRVRKAGSWTTSHNTFNDHGAQFLYGIPKQDQSLEEVEQLLLDQIELIKAGDLEDWIIPAIVTDFKKTNTKKLESNSARAALMRDSFLANKDWNHARHKLERMRRLAKKHVVKVARKYFKDSYVAGYRRDGEPDLPSIDKPAIDPIEIDPGRQSDFATEILEMPYDEIDPEYMIPGRDYVSREAGEGVQLYYARNPLNDLFVFEIDIDVGLHADRRLAVAAEFIGKSGTPRFAADELRKEWYRLGTNFDISTDVDETVISISGLDENFAPSLALLTEFLRQPTAPDSTLDELKKIILVKRQDSMKDHRSIFRALYRFNRHGDMSEYRRVLSNAELGAVTAAELHHLVSGLLSYRHSVSYAGSQTIEEVQALLEQHYKLGDEALDEPPPFSPILARRPDSTEIYFFDKEMAQALVRIESGDETYSEFRRPAIQLFNEYFYGGMAGIVFQELREARALAYSAWSRYFVAEHKEDENIMGAFIGCQADKTPNALATFIELIDEMPESPDRFAAAQQALINEYRTSRLSFREVLGAVHTWEDQGVTIDPRAWRFEQIQHADLSAVLEFQAEHIRDRPKLVSIVGDKSKIDMTELARSGKVVEVGVEEIFGY